MNNKRILFIVFAMLPITVLAAGQMSFEGTGSIHDILKEKFIQGNPLFMSFVAITLILGLIFCIERILYLSLSEINTKKFLSQVESLYHKDKEAALNLCRKTRGPIASISFQAILHSEEPIEDIERAITAYADVEVGRLEKGCSWITLFITLAPSLGFLGTVIGMVISFDNIEMAGDISPTIVAGGMKVALITTIFGIIVAVILQIFYNFILSRIDSLTSQMEQASIDLMDMLRVGQVNSQIYTVSNDHD